MLRGAQVARAVAVWRRRAATIPAIGAIESRDSRLLRTQTASLVLQTKFRFMSTKQAQIATNTPTISPVMQELLELSARKDDREVPADDRRPSPLPSVPFEPIILPPLVSIERKRGAKANHAFTHLVLQEYLAVLHALIQAREMDRAEKIFNQLCRRNPQDIKDLMQVPVCNAFIQGWMDLVPIQTQAESQLAHGEGAENELETPRLDAAAQREMSSALRHGLMWFLKLKQENFTPDAESFALVLRGLLRAGELQQVNLYLAEARRVPVEHGDKQLLSQILAHSYLTTELDENLVSLWNKILKDAGLEAPLVLGGIACPSTSPDISNPQISDSGVSEEVEEIRARCLEADRLGLPEANSIGSRGMDLLLANLRVLKEQGGVSHFSRYALQLKLEEEAYNSALLRVRDENSHVGGMALLRSEVLKDYMWKWHSELVSELRNELAAVDAMPDNMSGINTTRTEREFYGPLLKLLIPEKLAMLTVIEMLRLHVPQGNDLEESSSDNILKVNHVVISIGSAVEAEINAEEIRKRVKTKEGTLKEWAASLLDERLFNSQRIFNMTVRRLHAQMLREQAALSGDNVDEGAAPMGVAQTMWLSQWPQSTRAKVGSVLVSLLMKVAKVDRVSVDPVTGVETVEQIPAFYHSYTYVSGKKLGVVKFHPYVSEMLSRDPIKQALNPKLLPMVVRPRPWLTYKSGGYLTSRSTCLRVKDNNMEQLAYLRASAKNNRLNYILASLDVLGSTSWKVNPQVFEVVVKVWNSGEEFADIPPLLTEEKIASLMPKKPDDYDTNPNAKRAYQSKLTEFQNFVRNSYSLRCDTNYKVEIARTFLGQEMYFPHNVDFRGRAYPMPVHLNHISSDLCRGLMLFSEKKMLGARGWFWLKVHMASLHGYDKQSFTAREQWVMENLENILDSADNPLTGKRWWLKADDPWQSLATCYEISAAIRSGNPEAYESALPIHQDGTCNGLQHYAALGGDITGAQQVNLIQGERPADVYTAVANSVAEVVAKDAAKGVEVAKLLNNRITRKMVKQTVMTNVYGVTFVGARQQIQNRLKDLKEFSDDEMYAMATYLARKVFNSLGKMFHGAQKIQDWLNEVARRISKSVPAKYLDKSPEALTSVIWTTPLGLTCVQPYRREARTQVKTILQTIHLSDPSRPGPVNVMKQRSAFPPNFIHSLDASHMMMTAIACHYRGLTFASVHDSYWTHACDVDEMNEVIRAEFISLHSQPIMQNLLREFEIRYKGYMIPADSLVTKSSKPPLDKEPAQDCATDAETDADTGTSKRSKSWVPLPFLPLPERGDFDVKDVQMSEYFFH